MEPGYRHTRPELASMIDGELRYMINQLTPTWWKLQEVMRELSDEITKLHESSRQLQRWMTEAEASSLPLQDSGEDQDHHDDE